MSISTGSSWTLQEELASFRSYSDSVNEFEIPETPENRRPTNVKWLIILGVTILVLLPFMSYTLYYADISRITVGYDKCGNICGKKNYKWEGINCSGQDFTDLPYLEYKYGYVVVGGGRCVQSCKVGYTEISGRCLVILNNTQNDDEDVDLDVYFSSVKWQVAISCLLSILVAMGMLFLFRYAVAFVVWGILIGSFLGMLVVAAVFWYLYMNDPHEAYLIWGIVCPIMAILIGSALIWFRNKIHLVILLLNETTQAMFDMPGFIAIPVFTEFAILILTSFIFTTSFYMASAGTLQKTTSDSYTYVQNPVMIFTWAYNILVYIWLWQFFTDIQYMIIAGAVAKWYFSRDKSYLESPIVTSMSNAFQFHLGTVAMGSLIITIIRVIKWILRSFTKNKQVRFVIESCVDLIDRMLKILSNNAYIVTAIHGQPFLKSGKRAAKLLLLNFGDALTVYFIGGLILGMAMFLTVIVSVLLSLGIFAIAPGPITTSHWLSYIFVGVFAFVFAFIAFGVFETGVDTILICYCEDTFLNDGVYMPYFMSENLMEFIEKSKELYEI